MSRKSCATRVNFDADSMRIELTDGRSLIIPLVYFPRLLTASPEQREHYVISGGGSGLHWEEIDEDLLVSDLFLGIFDNTFSQQKPDKLLILRNSEFIGADNSKEITRVDYRRKLKTKLRKKTG